MQRSALFTEDKVYRYSLSRVWDNSKPYVLFVGLNPSTADENKDDPTIRKCINYAKYWGYGGLRMANLFAFRATLPIDLKQANKPVGIDNDRHIKSLSKGADMIVIAWGNDGSYLGRDKEVLKLIKSPMCLNINKSRQPSHPLYQKKIISPQLYI
jgi:hypothetical protein